MARVTSNNHLLLITIICSILLNTINSRVLNQIGRLYIPNTGVPGSENSAIDYENDRIFVADGYSKSVNSFDFSVDSNATMADIEPSRNIYLEPEFTRLGHEPLSIADITCVAMLNKTNNPLVLATIVPINHSVVNGWLGFVDPTNQSVIKLMEMEDCFLPDHVTSTYDGNIVLVSCEGEPSENEEEFPTFNPRGSVGYINVSSNDMDKWIYINIGFEEFDYGGDKEHLLPDDIYIPLNEDEGKFSLSAEPEHIVVDFEDKYGFIGLQENNAVAILDIKNKDIINIFSFGFTYFGSNGGLDASDKDNGINITEYANLYGMRQPDDIDYYQFENGRKFIFTANEGDSKGFDESRVKKLDLNPETFGDNTTIDILQSNEILGRLKVSNLIGLDSNDYFSELYTFSSRDFTVYEIITNDDGIPINISLQFSSMNEFEVITAKLLPNAFNSDYSGNTFDERSDAKGPEPEGITIGECDNGRLYVFICLERVGGIMVYDFTDIDNITFADYTNNRNFSVIFDADNERPPESAGDIGPEQMRWIPAEYYGEPLLVVSNPQSSSVTMYRIDCGEMPIIITTTEETNNNGGETINASKLSTLEIVAIAIGSFAVLSIIILLIFIICKKRKSPMDGYKYNSMNDGGNFMDNRGNSGHYFELEQ